MKRKVFWITFLMIGLCADIFLPFLWSLGAMIPLLVFSWWVAYRSEWFD